MELQVKSFNMKVGDQLREYIDKRVNKLDRVGEKITEAKFEIREQPHHNPPARFVAQFTIVTPRAILRAEEKNSDPFAVVDLVVDKMGRQIRRFHDRKVRRGRRDAMNLGQLAVEQAVIEEPLTIEPEADDETDGVIVRSKRFPVLPMDTAEAIEQLELLGHDFFVFYNAETSQMNVLYRRRDGAYGVLEPELA